MPNNSCYRHFSKRAKKNIAFSKNQTKSRRARKNVKQASYLAIRKPQCWEGSDSKVKLPFQCQTTLVSNISQYETKKIIAFSENQAKSRKRAYNQKFLRTFFIFFSYRTGDCEQLCIFSKVSFAIQSECTKVYETLLDTHFGSG